MRTAAFKTLLGLLALVLAACGGGGQPQDLSLAGVSPQDPTVAQGGSLTLTLTFTSQSGFQGEVSLSVTENGQSPSWLTFSPASKNLNVPRGGQVEETLQVQVAPNAPTGPHSLRLRATYEGRTAERDLTLTVTPPTYTNAFVYQVSSDGATLVGSAQVEGGVKPVVWRINPASLAPGFYWLSNVAYHTVLSGGNVPYGVMLGVTADGQVGCGYGSTRADVGSGDRALAWDLTTYQAITLPDDPAGGNTAYACAKSGPDIYIVGRVKPDFPRPIIWKNYTIWHQNTSVSFGIFHDITPDATRASVQLNFRGYVYDLNSGQYIPLSGTEGRYWSRISPDGQAVAFNRDGSVWVWYSGNVYRPSVGGPYALRVKYGVVYAFGASGSNAARWRSDTQAVEDLNNVFAGLLPNGVVLKVAGPISLDNRVMVFVAHNPASGRDEIGLLIGADPFRAAP